MKISIRKYAVVCLSILLAAAMTGALLLQVCAAEEASDWLYELTDSEVNLLAWVTYYEDNYDENSRMAVAETVLNRLKDSRFPDTLSDVLYAPKQFQVMKKINNEKSAPDENIEAVLAVFRDGESVAEGALFFAHKKVKPSKIARRLFKVAAYGTTIFYSQN